MGGPLIYTWNSFKLDFKVILYPFTQVDKLMVYFSESRLNIDLYFVLRLDFLPKMFDHQIGCISFQNIFIEATLKDDSYLIYSLDEFDSLRYATTLHKYLRLNF